MSDTRWTIELSDSGSALELWSSDAVVGYYRDGHVQMIRAREVPREVMIELLRRGEERDAGK